MTSIEEQGPVYEEVISGNVEDLKRVRSEFETYFEEADFGSSKLLALSDYIDEAHAESTIDELRKQLTEIEIQDYTELTKYAHPLEYKSNLRQAESLLTGIRLRVQDRRVTMPGYEVTRYKLFDWYEYMDAIKSDIEFTAVQEGAETLDDLDGETTFGYYEDTLKRKLVGDEPSAVNTIIS